MRISGQLPTAIGCSLLLLTGVADASSTTCATSVVCAEYINASSGVAIHGEANTGIGIRGTSNGSVGFYGASRSGNDFLPGVEGESLDHNGVDAAGAFGLTSQTGTAPAYGILAFGSVNGLYASTVGSGNGMSGSPTSAAVNATDFGGVAGSDTNAGLYAQTFHGTAVIGFANVTSPAASLGANPIGVYGEAENDDNTSKLAIGVEGVSDTIPLLALNATSGREIFFDTAADIINGGGFAVDKNAVIYAKALETENGIYERTKGSSGTTRMSYPARMTAPVMEDFGEAQLVNGRGYVKLDSALSDVIDGRMAYQVFLTPEGDSSGLYVTQKSPAGFVVRESRGGRSTLAFSYRILAKPVDDDAQRLAIAPPLPSRYRDLVEHRVGLKHSAPMESLDPFVRLKARLGPAEFARQIEAARKLESVP